MDNLTLREEAAIRAMQGLLVGSASMTLGFVVVAKQAVSYADALIAELSSTETQQASAIDRLITEMECAAIDKIDDSGDAWTTTKRVRAWARRLREATK